MEIRRGNVLVSMSASGCRRGASARGPPVARKALCASRPPQRSGAHFTLSPPRGTLVGWAHKGKETVGQHRLFPNAGLREASPSYS